MILSKIIDSVSSEMAIDKMKPVAQPNVREVFMNVEPHRLLELGRDLIEVEVGVEEGRDQRL